MIKFSRLIKIAVLFIILSSVTSVKGTNQTSVDSPSLLDSTTITNTSENNHVQSKDGSLVINHNGHNIKFAPIKGNINNRGAIQEQKQSHVDIASDLDDFFEKTYGSGLNII